MAWRYSLIQVKIRFLRVLKKTSVAVYVEAYVEAGRFYTVSVATLENSNDFSPSMAIYTSSAAKWATFPEGVPKYDTLPS